MLKSKKSNFNSLQEISKLTKEFKKELISGDLNMLGKSMHQNWLLKKSLSKNTTNSKIDQLYNYGIQMLEQLVENCLGQVEEDFYYFL